MGGYGVLSAASPDTFSVIGAFSGAVIRTTALPPEEIPEAPFFFKKRNLLGGGPSRGGNLCGGSIYRPIKQWSVRSYALGLSGMWYGRLAFGGNPWLLHSFLRRTRSVANV